MGGPRICFHPKSYFCCESKPHAKFRKPTITPSRRQEKSGEEREKNASNAKGQRTHSARANSVGIFKCQYYFYIFSLLVTGQLCKSQHHSCITCSESTLVTFSFQINVNIANFKLMCRNPGCIRLGGYFVNNILPHVVISHVAD